MTCVVCKKGDTVSGDTTVTLERGGLTLVVKRVPAQVCRNCGEAYVDAAVAERLLGAAEDAARSGAEVEVRLYAA
jgi:YgiT-type zinc finger domain-containing protein